MSTGDPNVAAQGPLTCGCSRTGAWLMIVKGKPYWWASFDVRGSHSTEKIVSIMSKAGLKSTMFYCASPKCKSRTEMGIDDNGLLEVLEDR